MTNNFTKIFIFNKSIITLLFLLFNNCASLGIWVFAFNEHKDEINSSIYKKKNISSVLENYGEPTDIKNISDKCKNLIYRKGDLKIKFGGIGASYLSLLLTIPLILPYGYTYDYKEFEVCDDLLEKEIRKTDNGHKFVGGLGFICLPAGSNDKCTRLIGMNVKENYRMENDDPLSWIYFILVWGTIISLL